MPINCRRRDIVPFQTQNAAGPWFFDEGDCCNHFILSSLFCILWPGINEVFHFSWHLEIFQFTNKQTNALQMDIQFNAMGPKIHSSTTCMPAIQQRISTFLSEVECVIGEYTPQKLRNSHCCVPFTATFSKRRKIGSLWSERCDKVEGFQARLPFGNWARIVPFETPFVLLWQNLCLLHAFSCRSRAQPYCVVFSAFSLEALQMWMCILCIFHINLPQGFSTRIIVWSVDFLQPFHSNNFV